MRLNLKFTKALLTKKRRDVGRWLDALMLESRRDRIPHHRDELLPALQEYAKCFDDAIDKAKQSSALVDYMIKNRKVLLGVYENIMLVREFGKAIEGYKH